jgi:hypothetical protein
MNIWGSNGKKLGETRESGNTTRVYDRNGQPSGSVKPTGTYNQSGTKITSTRDAGLLIKKSG